MTFARFLLQLSTMLPDLLKLQGLLMPAPPPPALAELGLADERGITRKGQLVLNLCHKLAALLDLPLH